LDHWALHGSHSAGSIGAEDRSTSRASTRLREVGAIARGNRAEAVGTFVRSVQGARVGHSFNSGSTGDQSQVAVTAALIEASENTSSATS
jgi:hypothetical protein